MKKRIIVVGGGYAGISLLHALKKQKNLELILIDKSQTHFLQTHLHKYLSGYYDKNDITFNHEKYCNKNDIEFINDEVASINYNKKYVLTRQSHILHYDYVVVATGSRSFFPKQIENVIEYTKDIKDIDNLDYYRDRFLKLLNNKPENSHIVVVGGGISGLQIACEYAQTIKVKGLHVNNIQVTIIEGLETILPGMDSFLIKAAQKRCEELGIKMITKIFASKINADSIVLSNGDVVPYNILLFVIGATGNLLDNSDNNIGINVKNQFIVDEYFQLQPYTNAFAIGDVVQAIDLKTKTFQAPTAQAARMQAMLLAKNIKNKIQMKPLVKNNISNKGVLIDLGGPSCAVGKLFDFNLSGIFALISKKVIYSLHAKKFN